MTNTIDPTHLARDAAKELLDDAVGLGRLRRGRAMADLDFRAGAFKIIGGKAGAAIREHIGGPTEKAFLGSFEEAALVGHVLGVTDVRWTSVSSDRLRHRGSA